MYFKILLSCNESKTVGRIGYLPVKLVYTILPLTLEGTLQVGNMKHNSDTRELSRPMHYSSQMINLADIKILLLLSDLLFTGSLANCGCQTCQNGYTEV